jgi:hypothetical protein
MLGNQLELTLLLVGCLLSSRGSAAAAAAAAAAGAVCLTKTPLPAGWHEALTLLAAAAAAA